MFGDDDLHTIDSLLSVDWIRKAIFDANISLEVFKGKLAHFYRAGAWCVYELLTHVTLTLLGNELMRAQSDEEDALDNGKAKEFYIHVSGREMLVIIARVFMVKFFQRGYTIVKTFLVNYPTTFDAESATRMWTARTREIGIAVFSRLDMEALDALNLETIMNEEPIISDDVDDVDDFVFRNPRELIASSWTPQLNQDQTSIDLIRHWDELVDSYRARLLAIEIFKHASQDGVLIPDMAQLVASYIDPTLPDHRIVFPAY